MPNFRWACLVAGCLYILIGASILIQGVAAMEPFGVPAETLASPHYADAITWVYLHQTVVGGMLVVAGWKAKDPGFKLWFARVALVAHGAYAALDFGHSEPVGNGLYEGPASVAPGILVAIMLVLFIRPALREERDQSAG